MEKEELIKSFEAITWGKRKNDSLYMSDIRYLCEKGIPAVEIAVRNISIADFEKGFNKWLNEQKNSDMKELKRTFIVEIKYPECDTMGNAEDYLQELIEGNLVDDDIGRWCVNVKEVVSNDEEKEDKIKYGKTLKDIAKSIDSIIARQQIKINELNEGKFK